MNSDGGVATITLDQIIDHAGIFARAIGIPAVVLAIVAIALARFLHRLRRASCTFEIVAEHNNDGIVLEKLDGTIIWCNDAYCRISGRPRDFWIGRKPQKWIIPPEDCPSDEEIEAFRVDVNAEDLGKPYITRNIRGDGTIFWNQITLGLTSGQGETLAVLTCRDVTEQVEREEALETAKTSLERAVNYDALTGLANRRKVTLMLHDSLTDAARTVSRVGLVHVDLDKFKEINDTHGHAAGDAVLVRAAKVLQDAAGTGLAARLGGDEFVLVLPHLSKIDGLEALAAQILEDVDKPITWEGIQLSFGASLGIAVSEPGMLDGEELIQRADFALYEAKAKGRGIYRVYDANLKRRQIAHKGMTADLAQTIREASMNFHFQPILDLATNQIAGVETLARWTHPQRGIIQPVQFIAMAEDIGLLEELDFSAIEAAADALEALRGAGHDKMYVSVNVCFQTLANPTLETRVAWAAERANAGPEDFVFEVLESVLPGGPGHDTAFTDGLAALTTAGFTTMLDDFGIGYAGLSHLARLSVTGIKVDRSLVRTVLADPTSDAIVRSILGLANELELRTVAEGVESMEIARRMRAYGCDAIQGYGLARPMPLSDLLVWLEQDPGLMINPAKRIAIA